MNSAYEDTLRLMLATLRLGPPMIYGVDEVRLDMFAMIGVFFASTSANDNGPRRPGHL
jgi:hypothetical protein